MEEERINEMIRRTLAASRRPPEPPLDAMWAQIEQRAFDTTVNTATASRRAPHIYALYWRVPTLAAAAALVVGIGLGWQLAPRKTVTRFVPMSASATTQHTAPSSPVTTPSTQLATSSASSIPHPPTATASPSNTRTAIVPNAADAGPAQLASQFTDAGGSDMSRYLTQTAALLVSLPADRAGAQSDTAVAMQAAVLLTQTHLLLDSQVGSDPTLHRLLEDLELVLAQVARLRGSRNGTDLQLIHQALTSHDVLPRVHDAAVEASITD